jgi:murein DD-endopeptidase MepM/ murein hydrolase activator NlpD
MSFSFFSVPVPRETGNLPAVQNGVGGGSQLERILSADEAALLSSFETSILEPESISKPRMLFYDSYSIQRNDTISELARRFGLNQDTLISVNGIRSSRGIQIGQTLRIPNQDGLIYTVRDGDTLSSIAERNRSDPEKIKIANELFSENINVGATLFIPDARLDSAVLMEINGDLFIWPTTGRISSPYGFRISPFTGVRQFHSGIDISAPHGTPIRAAMAGRVSTVGYDHTFGNYVVITHHAGYRTLYGHMSRVRVRAGSFVGTGERIGDVGSTGLSTGPHLHFTVFRNGVTVNPRTLIR